MCFTDMGVPLDNALDGFFDRKTIVDPAPDYYTRALNAKVRFTTSMHYMENEAVFKPRQE